MQTDFLPFLGKLVPNFKTKTSPNYPITFLEIPEGYGIIIAQTNKEVIPMYSE